MTESSPTWHCRQMPRSGCGVTGTYAANRCEKPPRSWQVRQASVRNSSGAEAVRDARRRARIGPQEPCAVLRLRGCAERSRARSRDRSPPCRAWCGTPAPRRGSARRAPPAGRRATGAGSGRRDRGHALRPPRLTRDHRRDRRRDQEEPQQRARVGSPVMAELTGHPARGQPLHAHGAVRGIGLPGEGTAGVEREPVDQSRLVEPRREELAARGLRAIVDARLDLDRAAPAHQADGLAVADAEVASVRRG